MGIGRLAKTLASLCFPRAIVVRGRTDFPPVIAVTFDDGPHVENTPQILDVLERHNVQATFFLQGDLASRSPALVREIDRRGHDIANHGYAHIDAKLVPTNVYVADVLKAQAQLEHILGRKLPRYFRPPFGNVTAASTLALLREQFRFVFWSYDSRDSFLPEQSMLVQHLAESEIHAGTILLFHDDYSQTSAALPEMLTILRSRGLRMVPLREIIKLP